MGVAEFANGVCGNTDRRSRVFLSICISVAIVSSRLPAEASDFREQLLSWGKQHRRDFPWRERERSLYEVFVAEFFLTQTPAENVADVYPTFLEKFPSLSALRDGTPAAIETTIKPLGFQRMRTDALCDIADEYDQLPCERAELIELPRVGPYVADATLCFACDRALPIVDRHVVRAYDRVFGLDFPSGDRSRRAFATGMVPDDGRRARLYNLSLLDFGALVCQKRDPECAACFASSYCTYYQTQNE